MRFIQDWQYRRMRKKHRKYAEAMGVFWKECPACGEFFGGHEWQMMPEGVEMRTVTHYYGSEKAYVGVCPTCSINGVGITMSDVIYEMFEKPVTETKPWPTGDDGNFLVNIDLDDSELLG